MQGLAVELLSMEMRKAAGCPRDKDSGYAFTLNRQTTEREMKNVTQI
jgi:hypothetical protein